MRIGILGYGKMGHAVERHAVSRNHETSILTLPDPSYDAVLSDLDCVIDFSDASVAHEAIHACLDRGVPVVSGTTGWTFDKAAADTYCKDRGTAFCWAPNFSIGMHITFQLNRMLARMMNQVDGYTASMLEVHHTQKRDSPSGTAIALAEDIIKELDAVDNWQLKSDHIDSSEGTLDIDARREEDVKGIHRVVYTGAADTISLRHHALSRDGFAIGAVIAAEKLQGKTGYFDFETLLNFQTKR